MHANKRGIITVELSESEIRACSLGRLEVLHKGCRRSRQMARVLQSCVVIDVPAPFKNHRHRETFEHPEIAAFARALLEKLPGFSFLINYDRDVKYKNFLLSTLSALALIRHGTRTTLRFPSDEWTQIVDDEVAKAREIASRALFSPRQQNEMAAKIREALKTKRF